MKNISFSIYQYVVGKQTNKQINKPQSIQKAFRIMKYILKYYTISIWHHFTMVPKDLRNI